MSDALRDTYARLSDARLVEVATGRASDLTPEAQEILLAELGRRGLREGLAPALEAQLQPEDAADQEVLMAWFRARPCPRCDSTDEPLQAVRVRSCWSFLLFTRTTDETVLACPSCLHEALSDADGLTALFGWWALPVGPVHTVRALMSNDRSKRAATEPEPSAELLAWFHARRGELALALHAEVGSEA